MATATETELERTVREEQEEHEQATAEVDGQDPDAGKLFEVPRVAVLIDDTDPDRLAVSFSGGVMLDRALATDVAWFNALVEGKEVDLEVTCRVLGRKVRHKLDNEGEYVSEVIATKSLAVTDVHFGGEA